MAGHPIERRPDIRIGPVEGQATQPLDDFITTLDRLGVPPTNVWPLPPPQQADVRWLKSFVGDHAQSRSNSKFAGGAFFSNASASASVFHPHLAAALVKGYTQRGDTIVDPFAGGGTRAVVAAALGRRYVGTELRQEEAERVQQRLAADNLQGLAKVHVADAASFDWPIASSAAALITCPPYWQLEKYSSDTADLSAAPLYEDYLRRLRSVLIQARRALKPDALVVIVAAEIRHPTTRELLDLPGDIIRLAQRSMRAWLADRITVTAGSSLQLSRSASRFDRTRLTLPVSETVIVLQLGRSRGDKSLTLR